MPSIRIYQLAKQNNLSAEALMAILSELGFAFKSRMSVATDEMIAAVTARFQQEKDAIKQREAEKKRRHAEFEKKERAAAAVASAAPAVPGREEEEIILPKLARVIETPQKEKIKPRLKGGRPLDKKSVEESFRKTLADLESQRKVKKYYRREGREAAGSLAKEKIVRVNEFMTVAELAHAMELTPAQVISKCMELGLFATINQRLDLDTIGTIALEFGFKTERVKEIGLEEEVEQAVEVRPRAPVVTIMGHVDHGKTSLLDHIRKTNVIAGEAGGITQHIGAYEVQLPGGKITFLDTPGHQAFTAMRARGAQITDIVVLVVAADDAVMPQTAEAIDHAKAAGVPIIVAINKIDLPAANPEQIKHQLSRYNLIPEEWGGKTIFVEISAKFGKNVDRLLEMILLQAELLELSADYGVRAQGTVVEARLDRGKGAIVTVLVQKGVLQVGETFVTGAYSGRVRALLDERGQAVREAPPSTPVQILGADGVPQAGDSFVVTETEQEAREVAARRMRIKREQEFRHKSVTLEEVYQQVQAGLLRELRVIVKGDVDGSVEALGDLLSKIGSAEVKVTVIHKGVGAINESDVLLAAASQAVIVGFHVRPDLRARELAAREKVDIRLYTIIYEAQEEIKKALEGLLAPEIKEKITGAAEVRQIFKISKVGTIAGSYVLSGSVRRTDKLRIVRDGTVIYDGKIEALKRFKDDAREVAAGFECGIKIENFNDVKTGDVIECYELTEVARKLE